MTTAKRPAARRTTASNKKAQDEALDSGVRMTIGDEVYEVRMGDVTPDIVRALRRECGFSFMEMLSLCGTSPDLDVVAAFVWTARLIRGEEVPLDEVAVSYADIMSDSFDIAEPGTPEVDEQDPEA